MPARFAVFSAQSFSVYHSHAHNAYSHTKHVHNKPVAPANIAPTLLPTAEHTAPWQRIAVPRIPFDPAYTHFISHLLANGLRIRPFWQLPRADKHNTHDSNHAGALTLVPSKSE